MNKLSKLTALLLALVLALGVPMQVMAEGEEIETWTEYMDIAKEALKTKIMAYETYGEYWDMVKLIEESDFEDFFYTLPLEDQHAIAKYVNDMFWASLVGYTNVAPLPELVEMAAPASMLSLTARDGDTGSEEAKGLSTVKQVSGPDTNGYFTITLENYATGKVTTTTTTDIKPVDIVLVLDDSGSMKENLSETVYTEVAYNSMDHDNEYYVKNDDGSYTKVTWCDNRNCQAWTSGCYDFWGHHSGTKYTNKETFYELTVINHGTKGAALITAVNNFVDSVNANSPTEGTHQMSIVKFSGDSKNDTDAAEVINVWTPVNDGTVNGLKLTGNDMVFDGGTWIEKGLTKAKEQLESLTTTGRQRVVIVFTDGKPGGGSWYNQGGQYNDAESVGASAINIAESIKGMENTTIYTIAVLDGADPTAAVVSPATGIDDVGNANKINAILHAISSNYPDATAQSSGDTLTTTFNTINPLVDTNNNGRFDDGEPGYYLSASSASDLNNIFQKISSNIQTGQSSVTLDEETIVRDVVTPYFEIPYVYKKDENGEYVLDENGEKIKDYTAAEITISEAQHTGDSEGKPVFGTPTEVDYTYTINGNVLDVTGFNFADNAVMTLTNDGKTSYVGKKLIITFKIKPVDGFLGGNDVETNVEDQSGIFKDQESADNNDPVVNLPNPPNVDVPLWRIQVEGKHQHLFLSNEADINELLQSFSLVYQKLKEDGTVDTSVPPYKVNGIRNGYATLQFTLADTASGYAMVYTIEPGADVGTWSYVNTETGGPVDNFDVTPFLTKDKEYTISYKVIPETEGNMKETTGSLKVGVHVYKPTFTFRDTTEKYLSDETAKNYYNNNNYVSESWSHTYYGEITVTINVTYDANGTPSYSYVATQKDGTQIASDSNWDMATETIDFSGYASTAGIDYHVKMSGTKPTVAFTYSPVETEWIKEGKVAAVDCVPVDVTKVTLTSTNTHDKVEQGEGGALTEGEYKTKSVYTEGSDTASVTITKIEENGTAVNGDPVEKDVTGIPHIKTLRNELDCNCSYDAKEGGVTDIHANAPETGAVPEFVIHITDAYSELKIIKNGLSVGESAIFTVTGYVPNGTAVGEQKTWTVVLTKASANAELSVTITGLLVGSTAAVEEAGNWSWRYQTPQYEPDTKSVEILPKTQPTATITITNTNKNNQWLDDEVAVQNNFSVNGPGTVID